MRRSPAVLLALAFAAAANAQTVVLSPFRQSGYVQAGSGTPKSVGQTYSASLNGQRATSFDYSFEGSVPYGRRSGWLVNFALPLAPKGASLVSATFLTTATGPAKGFATVQATILGSDGSLKLPVPATLPTGLPWNALFTLPNGTNVSRIGAKPGPCSFDVTTSVAKVLTQGSPYVELRIDSVTEAQSRFDWSSPTLALTYAPRPVPEPAALLPFALGALALLRRRQS